MLSIFLLQNIIFTHNHHHWLSISDSDEEQYKYNIHKKVFPKLMPPIDYLAGAVEYAEFVSAEQ